MPATLKGRFTPDVIIEELSRQRLIGGDASLARQFQEKGRLREVELGEELILQGAWDTTMYFVLAGDFELVINGQVQPVTRGPGSHLGDLTNARRDRPRTATVKAKNRGLVLCLEFEDVTAITGQNASFWKALYESAGDKLEERNARIGAANGFPRVFVISSSEGLDVARIVRSELDDPDKLAVHLWNLGTFSASEYPMSSLIDEIEAADFAVAVVRADDTLIKRKEATPTARDNVHLEYGMAVGLLGLKRAILLVDSASGVRLPSDLTGLTTVRYQQSDDRNACNRSVAKACDEIREIIRYLNVRTDRRC